MEKFFGTLEIHRYIRQSTRKICVVAFFVFHILICSSKRLNYVKPSVKRYLEKAFRDNFISIKAGSSRFQTLSRVAKSWSRDTIFIDDVISTRRRPKLQEERIIIKKQQSSKSKWIQVSNCTIWQAIANPKESFRLSDIADVHTVKIKQVCIDLIEVEYPLSRALNTWANQEASSSEKHQVVINPKKSFKLSETKTIQLEYIK